MRAAPADGDFVAVIGLARSGGSVAALLRRGGDTVYASDAGDGPELRSTAARLRALGVEVELGGHDLRRIAAARLAVVSPGVPPGAAPVRAARDAGVPVLSEIAVALQRLPATRVIAITGTNGKSTTTALAAHLLAAAGADAVAAGNIGQPLSEVALRERPPAWVALELSSFQLHDIPALQAAVGVLTNLSPDHLDRYESVAEYYADKRRLFDGATTASVWVTNADDAEVQRLSADVPGTHYRFSTVGRADAWYDGRSGDIYLFDRCVGARAELSLIGEHNVANALAASLAVAAALGARGNGVLLDHIGAGLRDFRGLPHRLERVAEVDGVLWINDSKATNVEAARVALRAMDRRPTVLLLGGRHKGDSYRPLLGTGTPLKYIIAYGEAAPIIVGELAEGPIRVERLGSDFEAVVQRAREVASRGDAVLLAPACSSYDMFKDYEERGAAFRTLALRGSQ